MYQSAHNLSGVGKWDYSGNYLTIIYVIINEIRQGMCIKFINFIPDFFNKNIGDIIYAEQVAGTDR